ncbi:MAG: hypothetical protein OXD01_04920 [Gammaproteobacteria bacterium]|nr:hypothetical protein [Gammaproteobacteria bacterium]
MRILLLNSNYTVILILYVFAGSVSSQAQESILDNRWYKFQTPHFTLISEASARQTRRYAEDLEIWRQLSAQIISGVDSYPPANVSNQVFLFDDAESLEHFLTGQEKAIFLATPRANFMASLRRDDLSMRVALHHYAHFLLRNFNDLRLPRWYEEGMVGYLSRMQIRGRGAEFERESAESYKLLLTLSESLVMERLLYQDEALASPRLIQIANLKSETLMHYLRHGYEDDWPDRRQQLRRYVELILEGRTTRYAFDQAFDLSAVELDAEFHAYLAESSRPAGTLSWQAALPEIPEEIESLERNQLAVLLGDLALNAGRIENAEMFFALASGDAVAPARAFSGLGDSLRFQDDTGRDQEIANYFEQALALAPNDPAIVLDYGEYWEAELGDCNKSYPQSERAVIIERTKKAFRHALELAPDMAEAHLAMAQVYLFPEEQWSEGMEYQRRAYELLPADSFIMEQTARYAIAAGDFSKAEALINELAQPLHSFGIPDYVNVLRQRLQSRKNNEEYQPCGNH